MNIKITNVFTPSEAQAKNNILGTVNLSIIGSDNHEIVSLKGITVRKDKQGNRFLATPSFSVGNDKDKKWYNHFSLFPFGDDETYKKAQMENMSKLTVEVLRILDAGGTRKPQEKAPTVTAAKPASKEPWQ